MIKIRFEEYWVLDGQFCLKDYGSGYIEPADDDLGTRIKTKRKTKTFLNARGFIKWNASRMESGWHESRPETVGILVDFTRTKPLALHWAYDGAHGILLHEVRDTRRGILFSDGAYAKAAEYESDEFKDLIQKCKDMADSRLGLKFCDKDRSMTYTEVLEKKTKEEAKKKELNDTELKVLVTVGRRTFLKLEDIESYIMDRDATASRCRINEAVEKLEQLGFLNKYWLENDCAYDLSRSGKELYTAKTGEDPVGYYGVA